MKTLNKTLSLAAFVCLVSFASLSASAQFTVGARAGVNLATEPTPEYYHVFLALPHAGFSHNTSYRPHLTCNWA